MGKWHEASASKNNELFMWDGKRQCGNSTQKKIQHARKVKGKWEK